MMTVTTVALTRAELDHRCTCGCPRVQHDGRRHGGRCSSFGNHPEPCPRFRRDPADRHAELARVAAGEPAGDALTRFDARRNRSRKTARARAKGKWGVGPSDIGECRKRIEYRERPPADLVPLPGDKSSAVVGTWMHEGWTKLQRSLYPWRQVKLRVLVPGFDEPGELDAFDPILGRVIDLKTCGDYKWDHVIAYGPADDDVDQVMLYGLALEDAGVKVDEVEVLYLHRSTGQGERFVRAYSRERALQAAAWLHDVLDRLDDGDELPRDRQGPGLDGICDRCPFVEHCWQVDASQLAGRSPQGYVLAHDEPEIAVALEDYDQFRAVASAAEKDKKAVRVLLDGLDEGRYGDMTLGWQRETVTDVPDLVARLAVIENEVALARAENRPPRDPATLPRPVKQKRTGGGIQVKRVRAAQIEREAADREAAQEAS